MSERDRKYNASRLGKKRKKRYEKSHGEQRTAYHRRYYRTRRLLALRASLRVAPASDRDGIREAIDRIERLLQEEGK